MTDKRRILIIGIVWPEPRSSAAGMRMMQLINFFEQENLDIIFACSASNLEFSEDLEALGIQTKKIKVNDSGFDAFVQEFDPDIVLFDRFMTEEQFGWRVVENCPKAIRILDTEDLHSLRYGRQKAFNEGREFTKSDLYSEEARRELASIYRCDLSLIISQYEYELLIDFFKVDPAILLYLPFMMNRIEEAQLHDIPAYEERAHFISIGNFLHEPNWDAVRFLKEDIWSKIRKGLPKAELHIYGAYTSQKVEQLHNEKEGFLIKGRVENAEEAIKVSRVLLAPLRFGAGLKGKLVDAMRYGTPSVTTDIGAEGLTIDHEWNGAVENDPDLIAKKAIALYQNKKEWGRAQKRGFDLFEQLFERRGHHKNLKDKVESITSDVSSHRKKNFIGSMLLQNTLQSYKYMSKWIEEKNKKL